MFNMVSTHPALFYLITTGIQIVVGIPLRENSVCNNYSQNEFSESEVGLIISPLISFMEIREIEIYWKHFNNQPDDKIALYEEEPNNYADPVYSFEPNGTSGLQKTGVNAVFVPTSNLTFTGQCLTYHVALLRNGTVQKTNCLRTRPNWMYERKNHLGSLKMHNIFLPGTHDSAAYVKRADVFLENVIDKYVITQDEDILSQLIYGARYLDIRVGYYSSKEVKWWANHGYINVTPLQTVINDVKTFLNNTKEIVIFDVQEFPVGFGKDLKIHHKLVDYLEDEFREFLLPNVYGWSSTLNSIWSSGKRLIIGYDQREVVNRRSSVWPCVTHQWGNVRTVDDLYKHLDKIESQATGSTNINPRSAMAELTPNTWDVILDRLGGLRKMAVEVDMNVTIWYNTKWYHSANIVAVDFIKASGIIETAIEWNDRRNSLC